MPTSLEKKIEKWRNENKAYLGTHAARFIGKTHVILHNNSFNAVFARYKAAMKESKKEDKLWAKIPLYDEAVKTGFRGSINDASRKKLREIITKKKEEDEEDHISIDESIDEADEAYGNQYEIKFGEAQKSAISGFITAYSFNQISGSTIRAPLLFIQHAREHIIKVAEKDLKSKGAIKFNLGLSARVSKETVGEDGEIKIVYSDDDGHGKPNPPFFSNSERILDSDRANWVEILENMADQIQKKIDQKWFLCEAWQSYGFIYQYDWFPTFTRF